MQKCFPATKSTIITADDSSFKKLLPEGTHSRIFLQDELLQSHILGTQVVSGVRIGPNDPRINSEEGLRVETVGGYVITIKLEKGEKQIRKRVLEIS